jgi:hypothetical protein
VLGVALATGALAAWAAAIARGSFVWMIWSDRDLVRSHVALSQLSTTGAELSSGLGARVPGVAYPLALWSALTVSDDPVFVWRVQAALTVLAAAVIGRELRARWGAWAAGAGMSAFLASQLVVPTVARLWNPGWLPLPAALAWVAAVRVVTTGSPGALVLWSASTAIAAQMHMSATLFVPALLPFLFFGPGKGARRAWPWAIAAALACYAPHLVDEALHGWPNTRALMEPQQTGSLGSGLVGPNAWKSLTGIGALLVAVDQENPLPFFGVAAQSMARVLLALATLAAAAIVARPSSSESRWVARAALSLAFVVVIAYARARDLIVQGGESARYILLFAPAWATLVALLAHRVAALRSGLAATALGAALALALAVEVRDADIALRGNVRHVTSWSRVQSLLQDAQVAGKLSLSDLAGRFAVARPDPRVGAWRVAVPVPVDYLLEREGARFPGSLEGGCWIALAAVDRRTDPPFDGSVGALSELLGPGIAVRSVGAATTLDSGTTLVPYTVDGRCPTSLVQRYLETPEETLARESLSRRRPGESFVLAADAGARRWSVWLAPKEGRAGTGSPVLALLDVRPANVGVEVTVHANQLRGYAYNTGVLGNAAVENLRLVMRDASGVVLQEVPLSRQRVGWTGESTPLRVTLPAWPDDGVTVALAADLLPEAEPRVWDGVVHTRVAVDVPLDMRSVQR